MNNEKFVANLVKRGTNNETKLQQSIQKYLKKEGAYEFKVHGSIYMKAGIPDIICCYKGLFIGIECKVGNNKQSEQQKIHEQQIKDAGGIYILAYSLDDVKKVINSVKYVYIHKD